jgi:hypothetical protein
MWMGSRGYRPEHVEALQLAYTRGGPLEREFYLSPEILNADIDRVWRRHWLYAGHDCEIANPGDWLTWQVGNDTIVLVRNRDNTVRAFHNTCRHRGARICEGERGNSKLLDGAGIRHRPHGSRPASGHYSKSQRPPVRRPRTRAGVLS